MLFLVILLATSMATASSSEARFDEQFEASWALDHIVYDGELVKLKLDNFSGAGFASKEKFVYGKASAEMRLVEGDSAGTVAAFYVSSDGPRRNEFDFEFLGNTTGEPYLVQTNVYVGGAGDREQRTGLWFDPAAGFHTYSILWSRRQVVFLVDETPVRVHRNREGVAFPGGEQAMGVYSSLWNADEWATQGGRVKTDWSHAPFVTTYRGVKVEEGGMQQELTVHQRHQLAWVRAHHLVYDYCDDEARFPTRPAECGRR